MRRSGAGPPSDGRSPSPRRGRGSPPAPAAGTGRAVGALGLTPGATYYISVDAFSSATNGTFTLCLQDRVDYDFYEGAIDLTGIINSCSANAIYTTLGATPDKTKGSTWNNGGPVLNRWFKFTATATGQINAVVDIGGVKGTQTTTQVALWQADGTTEIASNRYVANGDDVFIGATGLTPGATYYISVDALSYNYGTFTICLMDVLGTISGNAAPCPSTAGITYNLPVIPNATTYSWSVPTGWSITSGNGTSSIAVTSGSVGQNGNVSVIIGYSFGSGSTSTYAVTVSAIPTITGSTPASRCGTGTVGLGATASAGTVNWYAASTGGSSLGTGTGFNTPSISATTTYYVDATNNGCTTAARTAVTATVNTVPTITGSTPASRCGTGTVSLGAAASAGTINWYAASTGGSSLGTGISFATPSISATTTYYVDATSNGCTTASRTAVTATINAVPTITASAPASRCGTGTVSLGATASAGTINWYAASTGGSSLGTGISFVTPSISATTTYYVDATSNGCTTASRTAVSATINTTPTVTGTTPASRCGTGTVSLGATASAGTLNWYAASTGGSSLGTGITFITPSISATTTYYVDATNNGCTSASRTAVTATVNASPTITGTTPGSNCGTGTVSLGAAASAGTINWYAASTGGSSLGTGIGFITPSISATTTYYVDATNNGCTSASRTAVTATINATVGGTVSADQFVCYNSLMPSSLTLSGQTGSVLKWQKSSTSDFSAPTDIANTTTTLTAAEVGLLTANTYIRAVVKYGSCSQDFSSYATVTINLLSQWNGSVNTDWNTPGNWSCGVPYPVTIATIPNGLLRYPAISGATATVNNITVQTGAALSITGTLQVYGTLTAAAASITADSGTIEMKGTAAQVIPAGIINNELFNLVINNTAGVSLGGSLKVSNLLSVKNGAFATNNYLTLRSNSETTARVGAITSASPNPIVGDVTVERYVAGRRKYRLITSPVTTSTSCGFNGRRGRPFNMG